MVFLGQSFWRGLKDWRKYTPEEAFYWHLQENRFYPFEDLGNGFYYLRIRSDRFATGISILIVVLIFTITYWLVVGIYPLPTFIFIMGFVFGFYTLYGNLCIREIIISRLGGYLLRMQANKKVLCEQEIYNIYVRLQKKTDSVQEDHFFLIVGGYLLDDIRISTVSRNEQAMRLLGRRLSRNLGINYFDYDDETVKHIIYHYRSYSRLKWRRTDLAQLFALATSKDEVVESKKSASKVQELKTS